MSKAREYLNLVAAHDADRRLDSVYDEILAYLREIPDAHVQDEEFQTVKQLENTLADHRKVCEAHERRCPYESKLEHKIEEGKKSDKSDDLGSKNKKSKRDEAKALILKKRPNLWQDVPTGKIKEYLGTDSFSTVEGWTKIVNDKAAEHIIDEIGKLATPKERKSALHWFIKGAIRLPEDAPKVKQAIECGERAKGKASTDPMSYDSPMAMIEALHEFKPKAKPINPEKVPQLTDKREMGHGVVTYLVQDDREGQQAMRKIIDTHWGEDANPWCLLARERGECPYDTIDEWWKDLTCDEKDAYRDEMESYYRRLSSDDIGELEAAALEIASEYETPTGAMSGPTESDVQDLAYRRWWRENIKNPNELGQAWKYWQHYSALPKRVAFKDGKLLAFMATDAEGYGDNVDRGEFEEFASDELFQKYQDEIVKWGSADIVEVAKEYFPRELEEYLEREKIPEQWWDRQNASHEGIPLGNIPVPGDAFGRWADFEIRDGEMKQIGGYQKNVNGDKKAEWDKLGNLEIFDIGNGSGKIDAKFTNHGDLILLSDKQDYGVGLIRIENGNPTAFSTGFNTYNIENDNGVYRIDSGNKEYDGHVGERITSAMKCVPEAKRIRDKIVKKM